MDGKTPLEARRGRAGRVFEILDPLYTREKTALQYMTPLDLLVATILSAQCTDERVNAVTRTLFQKYRTPEDYLAVQAEELEADIRPTGFFRNKAKAIRGSAQGLLARFEGRVPGTMEDLLTLPGVGRKTANCVLGAVFDVPGIVVDTHVKRLSQRLDLTEHRDPDKIEAALQELLPRERWRRFSDLLVYHGRAVCVARKPKHLECPVAHVCPSRGGAT